MPIYEFVCGACGHQFEWLTRGAEKPACPSCGREKLDKLLSVPAAPQSGSGEPMCPARDEGTCSLPSCGQGGCGFSGLG